MAAPDTRAAITAALSNSRSVDVIDGIKSAIVREFEALDPSSTIVTTDYFNHSFVPDIVVKWSESGRSKERAVFLRFTLRAALLGRDIPALSADSPIVLTLKEDAADEVSRETVRHEVEESPGLLLTEVSALEQAIAAADREAEQRSPLLDLVRPNIVRGARGVLDATTVQALNAAASPGVSDTAGSAAASLERFERIVDTVFSEDAALRLKRAADILRIGLSADADDILSAGLVDESSPLSGKLSGAELTTLLPYLLSRPDVTRSRVFWSQVGSMMDLERLEEMAGSLAGLSLDPLVEPNLDVWRANRAYLSAVPEDEMLEPGSPDAGWRMASGLLTLLLSNWRLMLATNGRRLRGRSDSPSARWADLVPALEGFDLTGVTLQGVTRRVEIGSEDQGDVRADVRAISDSMGDDFFVPMAHVRERNSADDGTILADFPAMLTIAKHGGGSLRPLSRTALRVLAYRFPPNEVEFRRFLASESSPERVDTTEGQEEGPSSGDGGEA